MLSRVYVIHESTVVIKYEELSCVLHVTAILICVRIAEEADRGSAAEGQCEMSGDAGVSESDVLIKYPLGMFL